MTRPIPKKEVRTHKVQRETKLTRFITNLPQKYIWIGMAVLFIICFAWAFFSFGNFWSSENITVPNVVGKPVEVAETTLKKLDLKVSVDEIASDDVPAGQVISQTPAAGTNVKARRIIHLTVSKGGSAMLIPDLKGLTLEQAKERLDKWDSLWELWKTGMIPINHRMLLFPRALNPVLKPPRGPE